MSKVSSFRGSPTLSIGKTYIQIMFYIEWRKYQMRIPFDAIMWFHSYAGIYVIY